MKRTVRTIIASAALLMSTAAYSQIDLTGLQVVPHDQLPPVGNYYFAKGSGGLGTPPLPTPPDDPIFGSLPIYSLGNGADYCLVRWIDYICLDSMLSK